MATRKLQKKPEECKPIFPNYLVGDGSVNKLYHHFIKFDRNGDGTIDYQELTESGAIAANPLVKRIFAIMDKDRSGSIDFDEFVQVMAIFTSNGHLNKKLRCNLDFETNSFVVAFDIYDIDCDGFISNGELFGCLKLMSGDHLSDPQLQNIVDKTIRDADTDGDGKLSYDEFVKFVEKTDGGFLRMWAVPSL